MSSIRVLVVEDEILIADMIERYLLKKGHAVTDIAISYEEAEKSFLKEKPDLALLDIRLNGQKTGIDVARFIQSQPQPCPYIYLTSQIDSMSINTAKETFPAGYLPKPIQKESLYTTIEIAIHNYTAQSQKSESIQLFDGTKNIRVSIKDILFLRADHVYVEVNMANNQKVLQRGSLKDILERLPSEQFIQTHRSYAINIKQVSHWDYTDIYIQDAKIPISRGRRKDVKDFLESE